MGGTTVLLTGESGSSGVSVAASAAAEIISGETYNRPLTMLDILVEPSLRGAVWLGRAVMKPNMPRKFARVKGD